MCEAGAGAKSGRTLLGRAVLTGLLGGVFLPSPVSAAPTALPQASQSTTSQAAPSQAGASRPATQAQPVSAFSLRYAIYVHGFHALNGDIAYSFQPWGYGATAHIYTIGFANWLLTLNRTAKAEGRFTERGLQPTHYESEGFSRGKNRNVKLAFDQATGPRIVILNPPDEEREKLPARDLQNSIDLLSAFGMLLHKLDTERSCTVTSTIFDGLRLTRIKAVGPEEADLPKDHPYYTGSALTYVGPAVRCSFVGQQIAGFPVKTHHRARLAAPHPGEAWFREVKNVGMVPVRIELDYPKLGKVSMVMQDAPGQVATHPDNHSDNSKN